MVYYAYFRYKEEGVDVATLLVTFRDRVQFYQDDYDDWALLTTKLPLTFFVRNVDEQFEIIQLGEDEPAVHSDTLRISLV
jgi:hypothetical protein